MLVITVADDGPGVETPSAAPEGHGIANTRARLRALFGDRASLTVERRPVGGTLATLRVPYHEAPVDMDNG